ncbi:MAG: pre-peptidase C-terminal domain-containing protein [Candidatus Omnitrophica bacterium]|nr:pre-peptidase C-terminal domain-containing protein [Candidatus Omnitrophota bacterium]
MRFFGRLCGFLLLVVLGSGPVPGANPGLDRIYPPGGMAGATREVHFYGNNLSDTVDLLFHEPGISLVTYEVVSDGDVRAVLNIPPETEIGSKPVRVRTKTGLSNFEYFCVGNLNEQIETEPNNTQDQAQSIDLHTTVDGIVENEDVDTFRFHLNQGQRLSVEAQALRLGNTLFDAKLKLLSPKGHEIAVVDDTDLVHQDAAFTHVAEETGEYSLIISEAAYGGSGSSYYRLHVGEFPRPVMATPLGGQTEATSEITWIGDPKAPIQVVTFPSTPGAEKETIYPKTDQGIAPTPLFFRSIPYSGVLEVEPNNDKVQSTTGTVPGSFDGVLNEPGDVDWYHFVGKADQEYEFQVWGKRLGSPIDSVLQVYKPNGEELLGVDDAKGQDSYSRTRLPEDGVYHVRVTDHLSRGGAEFAYRVEITPNRPSIELEFLNNEFADLSLPQGNRALALLSARRTNIDGPIAIRVEGLQDGVTVQSSTIENGQEVIPLLFTANQEAPLSGAMLAVSGDLNSGDRTVPAVFNQKVVMVYGNNKTEFWTHYVRQPALAVTQPAPFHISVRQPKVPIVRQGQMTLEITADRDDGFTSPIDLRVPWTPSGVGATSAQIAEGATQTTLTLDAKGNAALGMSQIAVLGKSGGIEVSSPLIDLEIQEPWVTFEVANVETEQGKPVEISAKVIHKATIEGEYSAQILGLPKGVTAENQSLSMGTEELKFLLHVAKDSPPNKTTGLFVRTILMDQGEEVLHQSGGGELRVYEPLPVQEGAEPTPTPVPEEKKEEPERKTRFPNS